MSIVIRDMAKMDLPEVTGILNALLETTTYEWSERPHTVAEREDWFAAHSARGRPALVAVEGGEVVGCASYGDSRLASRAM